MVQVKVLKDFFFSQTLGIPIYDSQNRQVGRLRDMAIRWNGDSPLVTGIKYAKGVQRHIDIEQIDKFDQKGIVLKDKLEVSKMKQLQENEIYMGKWLLDKQIIDLNGSKLVRVNDIKLSWVFHRGTYDILLIGVDIGLRGLMRRIGLEFMVKNREHHLVGWNYIKPLTHKTANLQLSQEQNHLSQLHPADIADIIEELHHQERALFLETLDNQTAAEALAEVDLETQVEIIEGLDSERASDILEEMPADDAADILGELSDEKSYELLNLMEPEEAQDVMELMGYPPDTAGALMTTEFIAFTSDMTAEDTINRLRELAPSAEMIYYLYVVDDASHLKGVLSLRDLIVANPSATLKEFMRTRVVNINHHDDHDKVLDIVNKYNLLAVPVVDEEGEMLGIITIDNVLEMLLPDRSNLETFSNFMLPRWPERG